MNSLNSHVINYKNEITKMEDFLVDINKHELNYKNLIKKYKKLKEVIEESVNLELIINKLAFNQYKLLIRQLTNISEYVNLHNRVCSIIKYLDENYFIDKNDYIENIVIM